WMLADGRLHRAMYDRAGRMVGLTVDTPTGVFINAFSDIAGLPIAGTEQGAFVRGPQRWQLFAPDAQYLRIISDRPVDGRWLYTARNEIGWLRREGDRLVRSGQKAVPELDNTFNEPVRDASGRIWLELGIGRIGYVQITRDEPIVRVFTEKDGLPLSWPQLFLDNGAIAANISERILRFDEATQRFVSDNDFMAKVPGARTIYGRPGVDSQGQLWIVANGETQVRRRLDDKWADIVATVPVGFTPYFLTFEPDGVTWLHTQHRLARFDPRLPTSASLKPGAQFTELSVPEGRRHFFNLGSPLPALPYNQNTLVARFNSPGSTFRAPVSFEVRLEGDAPGEWVSVGSTGSTVLDRLKQGSYVLRVRARQGATTGTEDSIAFSIRPPWYLTPFAYISYAVLGISAVLLAIWLSTLFERREKNRLELLVAERTGELRETNLRLASQMDEIRVLTQAIAQSPFALFITEPDGTIIYTNPRSCLLTGRTMEQLRGFNLNRLRPDTVSEMTRREIAATLECGEPWNGQLAIEHSDGRSIPVRSTISPIAGKDDRVHHLVLEDDITEWLDAQERRRHLEAQLAQAQKLESIGTLAGGIAHDFNNILTGILGYCDLARMNNEQRIDNAAELEQIRAAGRRAKDLVSQILTFSRRNELTGVALDLRRPVEEALKLLRPSTPANIEFVQQLQSGTVLADASQIHQIVVNLGTNAIHAMAEGKGRLTISLEPVRVGDELAGEIPNLKCGAYMCLRIADTGQGMDATTLERIFDPFFTTKPQGKGTGLGLAIVQGAVMSHGGAVRVQSQPGVGTTFELYFPMVDAPPTESAPSSAPLRGKGEEILIVDDEPFVAEYAQALLNRQGYRCAYYTDPREALAAFRAAPKRFSILVTDLSMPNLTGLELTDAIRSLSERFPVIVLTGYGDKATRDRIASLPNTAMMQKPFNSEALMHLLAEMIRGPVDVH
ncbi:MAG TPA: ATP-binding protein, partial [Povalibacter sp.]